MMCSRYMNRIIARFNGKPFEIVDCLKYLGSQVARDVGCERNVVLRMNEEY